MTMTLSELERQIVDSVARRGVYVVNVLPHPDGSDGEEVFTYTVGLVKSMQWPEMICFGLGTNEMTEMLGLAIEECWEGKVRPSDGLILNKVLNGVPAKLVRNDKIPDNYMRYADWFADHEGLPKPNRLQLMWPDRNGVFPDDERCLPDVRAAQTPFHSA